MQQRVTGQIYVTFSTDVTAIQRQTIQVQYQATPRISVSGTRDQNGGYGRYTMAGAGISRVSCPESTLNTGTGWPFPFT